MYVYTCLKGKMQRFSLIVGTVFGCFFGGLQISLLQTFAHFTFKIKNLLFSNREVKQVRRHVCHA